jgi:hypothetical protein
MNVPVMNNYIRTLNFKSEIGQDRAVYDILGPKYDGTFVDIGCARPIVISNTFLFEATFNWRGIAVDIQEYVDNEGQTWKSHRPQTKLVIDDALKIDYSRLFKENDMPTTIDYLSLDLEPPDLTLECLYKIPFDEYNFNVITFEVDEYRENGKNRAIESRKYLSDRGYILLGCINRQDDVYVHHSLRNKE